MAYLAASMSKKRGFLWMRVMILRCSHMVHLPPIHTHTSHADQPPLPPATHAPPSTHPSLSQKCSQVWLVTRFPLQLWEISCATTSASERSPARSVGVTLHSGSPHANKYMHIHTGTR